MQNFHKLYRRPRGMYFCSTDKGEMVGSLITSPQQCLQITVLFPAS